MTGRLTLLIADREPTCAEIRNMLDGQVRICAEAHDVEQAIRAAKRHQPDLCLVSGDLGGEGLRAMRGICRAAPDAAVVVLAACGDTDGLLDAVRAGAIGYVSDGCDPNRLRRIVAAAAAYEAVVPRSMVLDLLLELRNTGGGGLTARESQVLRLLRRGHSTAQIALRLQIAPVTVRRHVSELVHKLGVQDRSALVGALNGHRQHA